MEQESPHVLATAKWIELGVTSARNPVVRAALELFVHPFGIRCEYLECDPVTSTRPDLAPTLLVRPRWTLSDVDPDWVGLFPKPAIRDVVKIGVDGTGRLSVTIENHAARHQVVELDEFASGKEILAINRRALDAIPRYIYKAFCEACLESADPAKTALFMNSPADYAAQLIKPKS